MQTHLVVVVPGLLGTVWHRKLLAALEQVPSVRAVVARSSHPVAFLPAARTLDGIDACGERLAEEVRDLAALHGPAVVSFVGQSFGGLVARRAAVLLWAADAEPLDARRGAFVTLGTPHLGVEAAELGWHKRAVVGALGLLGALPKTLVQLLHAELVMGELAPQSDLAEFAVRRFFSIEGDDSVSERSAALADQFPGEHVRIARPRGLLRLVPAHTLLMASHAHTEALMPEIPHFVANVLTEVDAE